MVTSELIINALNEYDNTRQHTEADFRKVRTLVLSNRNICTISNMCDFSMLTKLNVSNNALERLDGLQFLKSLEVLDASFNKLTSIEGIERLMNLTDLTLNNNKIEKLTPLLDLSRNYKDYIGIETSSHPLESVNLANNEISELSETLNILKKFVNIRILVLQNNPLASQQNYKAETTVYIKNLRYLDFHVIQASERAKFSENFTTEITQRKDQETADNTKTAKAITKARQLRIDCAADCIDFDNLVVNEIIAGEQNEKIFLIPAIRNESAATFTPEMQNLFRNLAKMLRRLRVLREGEVCEFEEFYDIELNDLQGQQDMEIQDYYIKKEKLWQLYNKILAGEYSKADLNIVNKPKTENQTERVTNFESAEQSRAEEQDNMEMLEVHDAPAIEEVEETEERGERESQRQSIREPESEQSVDMVLDDTLKESDLQESPLNPTRSNKRARTKNILKPELKEEMREQEEEETIRLEKEQEEEQERMLEEERRLVILNIKARLMDYLGKLNTRLISLEAETQNEIYQAIEQLEAFFNNTYKKRVEDVEPFFEAIRDCCEKFHSTALDILMKAVDKKMRKDAEHQDNALDRQNQSGEELIVENQQFTMQGEDSALAQQEVQEIENLLPADITPEVLALLKDRDTAKNANTLAWDYKLQIIEAKDTVINQSTNEFISGTLNLINGVEETRYRRRQLEIQEFIKKETEWIGRME